MSESKGQKAYKLLTEASQHFQRDAYINVKEDRLILGEALSILADAVAEFDIYIRNQKEEAKENYRDF